MLDRGRRFAKNSRGRLAAFAAGARRWRARDERCLGHRCRPGRQQPQLAGASGSDRHGDDAAAYPGTAGLDPRHAGGGVDGYGSRAEPVADRRDATRLHHGSAPLDSSMKLGPSLAWELSRLSLGSVDYVFLAASIPLAAILAQRGRRRIAGSVPAVSAFNWKRAG